MSLIPGIGLIARSGAIQAPPNHVIWDSPGTYNWVVPVNVTSIATVTIGGGGGSYVDVSGGNRSAGGGGALGWVNNIPVTPGETLTVIVGSGGGGAGLGVYHDYPDNIYDTQWWTSYYDEQNGGQSSVKRGTTYLAYANGGYGYWGRQGIDAYSINSGSGGSYAQAPGNYIVNGYYDTQNKFGRGFLYGAYNPAETPWLQSGTYGWGGDGSGGSFQGVYEAYNYDTGEWQTVYGPNGFYSSSGQAGAVRILWGSGRSFPSTNVYNATN